MTTTTMDPRINRQLENVSALNASLNRALNARFASQPANTAKSYKKPQRDWEASYSPFLYVL
jgi:hypothetical protein